MVNLIRRNLESVLLLTATLLLAASSCSKDEAAIAQAKARGPRPVAVRVAPVERGQLSVLSEYPGELFADAVDIAPRLSGRLVEVKVRLGDSVEKGQVVARLDDADLTHQLQEAHAARLTAAANGKRAEANLELARTELGRKAPLAKDELVSAQELSELQARVASVEAEVAAARAQGAQARARMGLLEEQRRDMRLVAPFDGTVAERRLDPGAAVGPSTPVVRLVAAGPARVRFRVPERGLATVRAGQAIRIRTAATGNTSFDGMIERIGSEVSRTDRAVQVEGVLAAENPLLLPGMYAQVQVQEQTLEDALLVPSAALLSRTIGDEEVSGVFVAAGEKADWRVVEVLGRQEGSTAVAGALEAGAEVLTLGHDELSAGSVIRVVREQQGSPLTPGDWRAPRPGRGE